MDDQRPVLIRAARIVATSAVAAGVAAGITALVLPKQKPTRSEQAEAFGRAALAEAQRQLRASDRRRASRRAWRLEPEQDRESLLDRVRDRIDTERLADAAHRAEDAGRSAIAGASDKIDTSSWKDSARKRRDKLTTGLDSGRIEMAGRAAAKDASRLVEQLRELAKDGTGRYSEAAQDALHDAADLLAQASERSRSVSGNAVTSLRDQREHAGDALQRARRQGGEQLEDLGTAVADTVDRLKPQLAKAGEQAGHMVGDLRSRLGDQVEHLAAAAQDQRPHLVEATERAAGSVTSLLKEAESRGPELLHAAEKTLHDAERVVQDNAVAARRVAGEAAENAAEETKAFGSLLLWLAIAIGLVYAFFMDDEQRRKARELAMAAYHEGRELYRDVRGRDGDFTA